MARTTPPKSSANRGNAASPDASPRARPWTAEEMAGARPMPMPGGDASPPQGAAPASAAPAAPPGGAVHVGSGRSVPGGAPDDPDVDTR